MNLQVLKKSRKAPVAGDVFVFRPLGRDFYYGRVVRPDARLGSFGEVVLFYLFDLHSPARTPRARLPVSALMVPPLLSNLSPWSRGYFEVVANRPFERGELLAVHCFENAFGEYVNEFGEPLNRKHARCASFALQSFRSIDDIVSKALGIPLAPDEPAPSAGRVSHRMMKRKTHKGDVAGEAATIKTAFKQLINALDRIFEAHEELGDTAVREAMHKAIRNAFIKPVKGYTLPEEFGMSSRAGNRKVRAAVAKFLAHPQVVAAARALETPQQRLDAFQDDDVESTEGNCYDDYFGYAEAP